MTYLTCTNLVEVGATLSTTRSIVSVSAPSIKLISDFSAINICGTVDDSEVHVHPVGYIHLLFSQADERSAIVFNLEVTVQSLE